MRKFAPLGLAVLLMFVVAVPAFADGATGTLKWMGRTTNVKFAYLLEGPESSVVGAKRVRSLLVSPKNLSEAIAEFKIRVDLSNFVESDPRFSEGILIYDIDGKSLAYLLCTGTDTSVIDDQYGGEEPRSSLALSANSPKKVAGSLRFDRTAADGPKVDIRFDATLVKVFAR